jgi:predicted RNase H-like HicB family nuclease
MKFIYPAVFHKTEEGTYQGYFPDLECCYAKGDTLEDAVENANEAAADWISLELSEEEPDLPCITDVSDISLKEGEVVRQISVNIRFYEGWDE